MPPAYQVDPGYQTRPRRVTMRRVATDETPPVLPSAKPPDAATVASRYDVIPQQPLASPEVPAEPQTSLTRPRVVLPAPSTPTPETDPYGLDLARQNYEAAKNAPVQKTSRLKAFGKMAMYALGQTRPGKDWTDVASQVGQGLGGGISGAVQPALPGAAQKLYNVQQAEEDLTRAEKSAAAGSLRDYRTESLDIRRDKMQMDQAYRNWQKQDKSRLTDNTINRTKFLQDYMKHKQVNADTQTAWMNDYRERSLLEKKRQFNANDEIKRAQLQVSQARQKTYEQSVKNGLTVAEAKLASEAAAGQAELDAADDYDDLLAGLDPVDDYDQILQIKRDQRRARREGAAKIEGARAAAQVRGTNVTPDTRPGAQTMPMTTQKPKNDPLGLFKP